ncbi:MAG: YdeI/OmpD-associated family protein, partial [Brucellaceae bacterium]|nr:YdeI/OmpD-associated family protein [Brucellaceae bacterium]
EIEKAGVRVDLPKDDLDYPAELVDRLDGDPDFRAAFEALTPGRQRGYVLHFSQPKQSATRVSRIDKAAPRILAGKGMHDR